jgi:hypothetical protein
MFTSTDGRHWSLQEFNQLRSRAESSRKTALIFPICVFAFTCSAKAQVTGVFGGEIVATGVTRDLNSSCMWDEEWNVTILTVLAGVSGHAKWTGELTATARDPAHCQQGKQEVAFELPLTVSGNRVHGESSGDFRIILEATANVSILSGQLSFESASHYERSYAKSFSFQRLMITSVRVVPVIFPPTGQPIASSISNIPRFSIPRRNGVPNLYERYIDVDVAKAGGQIVDLSGSIGWHGQDREQILQFEPIGFGPVQVIQETQTTATLRVQISMHHGSPVHSDPPAAHEIHYSFTVRVSIAGLLFETEPARSSPVFALWRMPVIDVPDDVRRYTPVDPGGDDWCSAATYAWLENHHHLLRALGDLSGEHGRNIGHPHSHHSGKDLDVFHFYRHENNPLLQGGSGSKNYSELRDDVVLALADDVDARRRIRDWVLETRQGMNAVLALNSVAYVYYSCGAPFRNELHENVLDGGWARRLLVDGSLTVPGGNLTSDELGGLPRWNNSAVDDDCRSDGRHRLLFDNNHDNHIHIALNVPGN